MPTLINQAEARANPGEFSFLKFALTLLVPYLGASAGRQLQPNTATA